jgi:glycosyltransferase involved in cell wall biosynthesis
LEHSPELKTTISLPLAIWGEGYGEFLPRWFEGVLALEREIDEIVVVCDEANFPAVMSAFSDFSKVRIRVEDHPGYSEYWNRAIDLCQSKWVAICNADDYFLPEALNEIDQAEQEGCNLVLDHLLHKHNNYRQTARWEPEALDTQFSLMGANPMTKRLWEASGGFPRGVRFADWGLALRMRKTGLVKPFYASTTRIVYDVGTDRLTLSGAKLPGDKRAEGENQIHQIAKELAL